MSGFLRKDFYQLRKMMGFMGGVGCLYLFSAVIKGDPSMFGMLVMLFGSLLVTAYYNDEYSHWNRMARCMPVSDLQIVGAKYVMGLLLLGAGMLTAGILYEVVWIIDSKEAEWHMFLEMSASWLGYMMLYNGVSLPLLIRFGTEHTRILMLLLSAGMAGLFLIGIFGDPSLPQLLFQQHWGFIFIAGILVYAGSFWVSVLIFRKKEE